MHGGRRWGGADEPPRLCVTEGRETLVSQVPTFSYGVGTVLALQGLSVFVTEEFVVRVLIRSTVGPQAKSLSFLVPPPVSRPVSPSFRPPPPPLPFNRTSLITPSPTVDLWVEVDLNYVISIKQKGDLPKFLCHLRAEPAPRTTHRPGPTHFTCPSLRSVRTQVREGSGTGPEWRTGTRKRVEQRLLFQILGTESTEGYFSDLDLHFLNFRRSVPVRE